MCPSDVSWALRVPFLPAPSSPKKISLVAINSAACFQSFNQELFSYVILLIFLLLSWTETELLLSISGEFQVGFKLPFFILFFFSPLQTENFQPLRESCFYQGQKEKMLKTWPQKELQLEEAVWTEFPFQDPAHTGARSPQSHPNALLSAPWGGAWAALVPLSVAWVSRGWGREVGAGAALSLREPVRAVWKALCPGRAACGAALLPFRSVAKAALGGGASDGALFDIKIQFSLASGQVGVCLLIWGPVFFPFTLMDCPVVGCVIGSESIYSLCSLSMFHVEWCLNSLNILSWAIWCCIHELVTALAFCILSYSAHMSVRHVEGVRFLLLRLLDSMSGVQMWPCVLQLLPLQQDVHRPPAWDL